MIQIITLNNPRFSHILKRNSDNLINITLNIEFKFVIGYENYRSSLDDQIEMRILWINSDANIMMKIIILCDINKKKV